MSILRWTPERLADYQASRKADISPLPRKTPKAASVKIDANAQKRAAKPSKYRNLPQTSSDGEKYRSKREMKRHQELLLLEKAERIVDLRREVPFLLVPSKRRADGKLERAASYLADFVYQANGISVVEDVKSPASRTPLYVLKRKLMLMIHGIAILET